ncbi:hypothetical protein BGZ60DRAFT_46657 [Tricladium varicosporioides]|nr:hypothetical protein BGZ60DRAFT_46657 [Hymenoscyphus varicosporioides]
MRIFHFSLCSGLSTALEHDVKLKYFKIVTRRRGIVTSNPRVVRSIVAVFTSTSASRLEGHSLNIRGFTGTNILDVKFIFPLNEWLGPRSGPKQSRLF